MRQATQPPKGGRQVRRDAKREKILKSAVALLDNVGFEALSLRAVAHSAGVSPAGMYELFDSRQALMDAMGERFSRALARSVVATLRGKRSPVERLVRFGMAYLHFARREKEHFLSVFTRCSSQRRSLADEVPEGSFYALLLGVVRELLGPAVLASADPRCLEAFTYGAWSLMHGMVMLELTTLAGFRAAMDAAARRVLETYARGVASFEPPKKARRGGSLRTKARGT